MVKSFLADAPSTNLTIIKVKDLSTLNMPPFTNAENERVVQDIVDSVTVESTIPHPLLEKVTCEQSGTPDKTPFDLFKPAYLVQNPNPYVVLNFDASVGETATPESVLKTFLISAPSYNTQEKSSAEYPLYADIITLVGPPGVGKSTAVEATCSEADVRQFFSSGIYHISMGEHADAAHVLRQLSRVVASTGDAELSQKIDQSITLKAGVDLTAAQFSGRKALFVLDDVCPTRHNSMGLLSQLRHLTSRPGRLVVLTCSEDIASTTEFSIKVSPRIPASEQSRLILAKHIDQVRAKPEISKNFTVFDPLLDHCAGFPIVLALAGRSINHLAMDGGLSLHDSIEMYLGKIKEEQLKLVSSSIDSNFDISVLVALELANVKIQYEFSQRPPGIRLHAVELFMRLSVFRNCEKPPLSALAALWSLSQKSTDKVVDIFHSFNLVSRYGQKISISNACRNTCSFLTNRSGDIKKFHSELLSNYYALGTLELNATSNDSRISMTTSSSEESASVSSKGRSWSRLFPIYKQKSNLCNKQSGVKRLPLISQQSTFTDNAVRAWWDRSVHIDNYLSFNLFWHLSESGNGSELELLLTDKRWLSHRVVSSNPQLFKTDFSFLSGPSLKSLALTTSTSKTEDFQLIQSAVLQSWHRIRANPQEFELQIYGRLGDLSNDSKIIGMLLQSIVVHGKKPWLLLPTKNCFSFVCIQQPTIELTFNKSISAVAVGGTPHNSHSPTTQYAYLGMGKTVSKLALDTKSIIANLTETVDEVTCLSVSDDGSLVVAGLEDGSICTWNAETGGIVREIHMGHYSTVTCVAASRNGNRIVSGSQDGSARIWKARTIGVSVSLAGHTDTVTCAVMSPDGKRVVTGSRDCTVRAWDVKNEAGAGTVLGSHNAEVLSVSYSSDGRWSLSCGGDNFVKVWDMKKKSMFKSFSSCGTNLRYARLTSDDVSAIAMSDCLKVENWNFQNGLRTGHAVITNEELSSRKPSIAISHDGRWAVTGNDQGEVRVLDIHRHTEIAGKWPREMTINGHNQSVICVSISTNGQWGVSLAQDETAAVWSVGGHASKHKTLRNLRGVVCVFISNDGRRIISGSRQGVLKIWNLDRSSQEGRDMQKHTSAITCLSQSEDCNFIVSGSANSSIDLWNLRSQKPVGDPFIGHTGAINCIAFSSDGNWIVSGSVDRTVRLWRRSCQTEFGMCVSHDMEVTSLNISRENIVTSVSKDKIVSCRIDSTRGLMVLLKKSYQTDALPLPVYKVDRPFVQISESASKVFHMTDETGQDIRLQHLAEKIYLSAEKQKTVATLHSHITCMSVAREQKQLLTGHADGSVNHFRLTTSSHSWTA